MIDHIIKNAIDAAATFTDEQPKALKITCKQHDGAIEICCRDNCGGIPQTALPHVFDPFFTTKDPDKGMGLGLSVFHGIVASMGGSISVANDSTGARFTLELPIAS